jgi:hypothetical protein
MTVQAIVFGPDNVPVVTDPANAAQDVCFAVLSALTHSRSRNVGGMLKALAEAPGTLGCWWFIRLLLRRVAPGRLAARLPRARYAPFARLVSGRVNDLGSEGS